MNSPLQKILKGLNMGQEVLSHADDSEQQGLGVQTLRRDLWGYYGAQHIAKVVFLQRAIRKYLVKLFYSRQRLELLYEYK